MKNDKIKKRILSFFYRKMPNALLSDHIVNALEINKEIVEVILEELLSEGEIKKGNVSEKYPHRITYHLVNEPNGYPFDEYIQVGDYSIPRLLDMDFARAEDVNQSIEAMHKYSQNLGKIFKNQLESQIKRFFGNMIAIFGVFIAIFALVITGVNISSDFTPKQNIGEAFLVSFAIYLPLIIVLLLIGLSIWLLNKTLIKSE